MGTRESGAIAYIHAASNFDLKMRIDEVGGNRKRTVVSNYRLVGFGEEEMRLREVKGFWKLNIGRVESRHIKSSPLGDQTGDIYGLLSKQGHQGTVMNCHDYY